MLYCVSLHAFTIFTIPILKIINAELLKFLLTDIYLFQAVEWFCLRLLCKIMLVLVSF